MAMYWEIEREISGTKESVDKYSIELEDSMGRGLLVVEHQAPNLNRLPLRSLPRTANILERRMRRQSRDILLRVVALDEDHLIRGQVRQEVPLVVGVAGKTKVGTHAIRVDVFRVKEVVGGVDGGVVAAREGPVGNGVGDGTPGVDNTNAGLEEAVSVVT